MHGNNYTKASPGSTGQTTNDKRPLGINLESALLHRKQNHNLSPSTTTPRTDFGCGKLRELWWSCL